MVTGDNTYACCAIILCQYFNVGCCNQWQIQTLEIRRGGGVWSPKQFFSALRASIWSKNKKFQWANVTAVHEYAANESTLK